MHKMIKKQWIVCLVLLGLLLPAGAQIIRDPATLSNMKSSLQQQRELAAGRNRQLFDVLGRPLKTDERLALEYLYAYMPLSDLADYNGEYFLEQVQMTLKARQEMKWGSLVPEEVFLHFVLPVRVNNENLDDFRKEMYQELKNRVQGLDMASAALEVNHWCHEKVTYRGSDERTSSPLASVKTSFGRCGEESTFTVAAMRTVGIPARQVYTPRWAHSDDNHAWVEVWIDGKWFFLGACEPEAGLNMGWFAAPAMRAMLVHTRAYGWYNGNEPVIDRQAKFSELNLIGNYAETKMICIHVVDENSKPVPNANVEYQLYNYAEFYPIAKGKTSPEGYHSIETGLGDLIIWIHKDGNWNYSKITVEQTDTLTIRLNAEQQKYLSASFDLIPPVEKKTPDHLVSAEAREINARRLLEEDSIRSFYMSSFMDSTRAVQFALSNGYQPSECMEFLLNSYGNWKEITAFLQAVTPAERSMALRLLGSISSKDLRDTRLEILLDHLRNAPPYPDNNQEEEASFFASYILSGRISNEMMRPWRGFLQQQFTNEFRKSVSADIGVLVRWITDNIRLNDTSNMHSRSPLSPRGVYELRIADNRSRDIFFVAVCRSLGIPARINPATYLPQYYSDNQWINIAFEPSKENVSGKGFIRFVNGNTNLDPKYAVHFTIARFRNGVYRSLDLEYGQELSRFPEQLEVEAGKYYLVTGNRQSDGSVLSTLSFFEVSTGNLTTVHVNIRESAEKHEPWAKVDLKKFRLENYGSATSFSAAEINPEQGSIFIWIDPDKEPSKHVMADMPAVKQLLEKWNGAIIFLLQKDRLSKSFQPGMFRDLPAQHRYAFDLDSAFIKEIERLKGHALQNNFPVVIISDAKGNLMYFSEGYKIGIGEQLAKEVSKMK